MDIVSVLSIVLLVGIEISVLVWLYRNYITSWNAEKWEQKSREEGWLSSMLEDVIVEVAEMVSSTVIEQLKQEYTRAQGTLTRVSKSGEDNPATMGLEVAESILKSMGWKNPNVLMVARLAQTLGGLISKDSSPQKVESIPVGADLFRGQ
jgi:hypothetical protein